MAKEQLIEVPEADYLNGIVEVPPRLLELAVYLNNILKVAPWEVTQLLDHEVPINSEELGVDLSAAAPAMFMREDARSNIWVSGLGVLGGFANTKDFRLFAAFENDQKPYGNITRFGIYFVTYEEEKT